VGISTALLNSGRDRFPGYNVKSYTCSITQKFTKPYICVFVKFDVFSCVALLRVVTHKHTHTQTKRTWLGCSGYQCCHILCRGRPVEISWHWVRCVCVCVCVRTRGCVRVCASMSVSVLVPAIVSVSKPVSDTQIDTETDTQTNQYVHRHRHRQKHRHRHRQTTANTSDGNFDLRIISVHSLSF